MMGMKSQTIELLCDIRQSGDSLYLGHFGKIEAASYEFLPGRREENAKAKRAIKITTKVK